MWKNDCMNYLKLSSIQSELPAIQMEATFGYRISGHLYNSIVRGSSNARQHIAIFPCQSLVFPYPHAAYPPAPISLNQTPPV